MARNPKQDANLKPIKSGDLSKEELKKRQSNGGKKSGEVRRAKRDARQSARYILGLSAKGDVLAQLEKLGADKEDGLTNMELLQARLFVQATGGNLDAAKMLLNIAGYDTEENRKERESLNADRRRDVETQFKMDTMAARGIDSANVAVNFDNEEGGNDVIIYLPAIEKEEDAEMPEEDPENLVGLEDENEGE